MEYSEGNHASAQSSLEEAAAIARESAIGGGSLTRLLIWELSHSFSRATTRRRATFERRAPPYPGRSGTGLPGVALAGLAHLARVQGNDEESYALFREALIVSSEIEDSTVMPRALAALRAMPGLPGLLLISQSRRGWSGQPKRSGKQPA